MYENTLWKFNFQVVYNTCHMYCIGFTADKNKLLYAYYYQQMWQILEWTVQYQWSRDSIQVTSLDWVPVRENKFCLNIILYSGFMLTDYQKYLLFLTCNFACLEQIYLYVPQFLLKTIKMAYNFSQLLSLGTHKVKIKFIKCEKISKPEVIFFSVWPVDELLSA